MPGTEYFTDLLICGWGFQGFVFRCCSHWRLQGKQALHVDHCTALSSASLVCPPVAAKRFAKINSFIWEEAEYKRPFLAPLHITEGDKTLCEAVYWHAALVGNWCCYWLSWSTSPLVTGFLASTWRRREEGLLKSKRNVDYQEHCGIWREYAHAIVSSTGKSRKSGGKRNFFFQLGKSGQPGKNNSKSVIIKCLKRLLLHFTFWTQSIFAKNVLDHEHTHLWCWW